MSHLFFNFLLNVFVVFLIWQAVCCDARLCSFDVVRQINIGKCSVEPILSTARSGASSFKLASLSLTAEHVPIVACIPAAAKLGGVQPGLEAMVIFAFNTPLDSWTQINDSRCFFRVQFGI